MNLRKPFDIDKIPDSLWRLIFSNFETPKKRKKAVTKTTDSKSISSLCCTHSIFNRIIQNNDIKVWADARHQALNRYAATLESQLEEHLDYYLKQRKTELMSPQAKKIYFSIYCLEMPEPSMRTAKYQIKSYKTAMIVFYSLSLLICLALPILVKSLGSNNMLSLMALGFLPLFTLTFRELATPAIYFAECAIKRETEIYDLTKQCDRVYQQKAKLSLLSEEKNYHQPYKFFEKDRLKLLKSAKSSVEMTLIWPEKIGFKNVAVLAKEVERLESEISLECKKFAAMTQKIRGNNTKN